MQIPPTFVTTNAIARAVGKNRVVVERLMRQQLLKADAFVDFGSAPQPVFLPERAVDVLKIITQPKRRAFQPASSVRTCEQNSDPVRTCAQDAPA